MARMIITFSDEIATIQTESFNGIKQYTERLKTLQHDSRSLYDPQMVTSTPIYTKPASTLKHPASSYYLGPEGLVVDDKPLLINMLVAFVGAIIQYTQPLADCVHAVEILSTLVAAEEFVHLFHGYSLCLRDVEQNPDEEDDAEC